MKRSILFLAVIVGLGYIMPQTHAQVRKANRALKNGQFEEALGFIDAALEKKPEDAKAFEARGHIYREMAAVAEGEEYLSNLRMMLEAYNQAASLDRKAKERVDQALLQVYLVAFRMGIEAFTHANATDTTEYFLTSARFFEGATIIKPDSSGSYVNWAYAMLRANDDVGAIRPFELALKHGPPDSEVYTLLSRIYLTNDREDDAVTLLEEAKVHFPDDSVLQELLLNAYSLSGQIERAIEVYAESVASQPDHLVYRYNYGSLLLQAERHDEAIEQLEKATSLDPDHMDAQYNLGAAYVNKAVLINDRMSALEDSLGTNKASLSDEAVAERRAEIDALAEVRSELFAKAIAPLERAKELGEGDDRDVQAICRVLYQSYAQTNQMDKVASVEACAGM